MSLTPKSADESNGATEMEKSTDSNEKATGVSTMYDLDPEIWGPIFWRKFHLLAYCYPESPSKETKEAMFKHFYAMREVMPCSNCRKGFNDLWSKHDLHQHLSSRALLIEWVILIHDAVNEKLGKQPLDYAAFMEELLGESVVQQDDDEQQESQKLAKTEKKSRSVGNSKSRQTPAQNAATNIDHARRLRNEQNRQVQLANKRSDSRLNSYHAARFAMQRRAKFGQSNSSIASRVEKPRECENCNRKVFVPSVFS